MIKKHIVRSGSILYKDEIEEYFRAIKEANLSLPGVTISHHSLVFTQGYVGTIFNRNYRTGSMIEIEVVPSIEYLETYDYLRLVSAEIDFLGYEKPQFDVSGGEVSRKIVSLFIERLIFLCDAGLPKRYNYSESLSECAIGNTDYVESSFRYILVRSPVFISTRESAETDSWPLVAIKAAYEKLLRAGIIDDILRVTHSLAQVPSVRVSPREVESHNVYFSSFEKPMKEAYEIAVIILNNLDYSWGDKRGYTSLLINSNSIFEEFIRYLLEDHVDRYMFDYHHEFRLASNETGSLERKAIPDFLYNYRKLPSIGSAVLDAKNKDFRSRFQTTDIYELFTYCTAAKAELGVLIYPWTSTCFEKLDFFPSRSLQLFAIGLGLSGWEASSNKRESEVSAFRDIIKQILGISS